MSRRYALAEVFTLKWTVWPASTLMSVAKPWMPASPAPLTSHSLGGLPALVFSHATGLTTGGPHGPAACAPGTPTTSAATSGSPAAAARTRRREDRRGGPAWTYPCLVT